MSITPPTHSTEIIRPSASTLWKHGVDLALEHHKQWWEQQGMVLWVTAPKDQPWEDVPAPPPAPETLEGKWYDPYWKPRKLMYEMSRMYYGGDSFPMFRTWTGAGDLAAYLGCPAELAESTIWYHPILDDPERPVDLRRINLQSDVLLKHFALVDEAMKLAQGKFFVALPDIIENIDILASLRGTQNLLMDMVERPEWVVEKVSEINQAFFQAFDLIYERVRDVWGGNTFVFNLWGPGKTCKVQCDACSMFGPDMFRRMVKPSLEEQCRWLDFAMYHLDGEDCLVNLDVLLEIEDLQAIEWTPRMAYTGAGGGIPEHYSLYQRILKAGKSVQAIEVKPQEVIPLLDACGPKGMFIVTQCQSEEHARQLEEQVNRYR